MKKIIVVIAVPLFIGCSHVNLAWCWDYQTQQEINNQKEILEEQKIIDQELKRDEWNRERERQRQELELEKIEAKIKEREAFGAHGPALQDDIYHPAQDPLFKNEVDK